PIPPGHGRAAEVATASWFRNHKATQATNAIATTTISAAFFIVLPVPRSGSTILLGVSLHLSIPFHFHSRTVDYYRCFGIVIFSKNSSLREFKSSVIPLVFE